MVEDMGRLKPAAPGLYVEVGNSVCRDADGKLWTVGEKPTAADGPCLKKLPFCMRTFLARRITALGLDNVGHVWELPHLSLGDKGAPPKLVHPLAQGESEGDFRFLATLDCTGCTYIWRPVASDPSPRPVTGCRHTPTAFRPLLKSWRSKA
jgi:hypothetical protein